jgi:serine/threonine protein kinase
MNYKLEETNPESDLASIHNINDCGVLLHKYDLSYISIGNYYQVGSINWTQGWILHISVVMIQIPNLLNTILPFLKEKKVPFKIVKTLNIGRSILGGSMGLVNLGKIVTIYTSNDEQATELAIELITLTKIFRGPQILTDRKLGSVVYTRYGACNPKIRINEYGIQEEYIYDINCNLILDKKSIPFKESKKINWPFSKITTAKVPKQETILQDKYKPMSILKEDAKGDVKKVLWLKKIYQIKWCVLKEGKQYMSTDSKGRDIGDRLHWQFELHKDLENFIPIPKVYDLFQENGNTYLAMQYINGDNLGNVIKSLFNQSPWSILGLEVRQQLMCYAMQILDIIECMHTKGYIHRDITTANFLVTKKQKLWTIDLELCYSKKLKKPYPPFRLGTDGFMSPEQQVTDIPTEEQDIYALGAILIYIFTGLMPYKFTVGNRIILQDQLLFFIPDIQIVTIICKCTDNDPNIRPTISTIKNVIELALIKQKEIEQLDKIKILENNEIRRIINKAINGLCLSNMLNNDNLWVSKAVQAEGYTYDQDESLCVYENFHDGISGIMFLIARAKKLGLDITACMISYNSGLQFLQQKYTQHLLNSPAGLYAGTAGLAICLAEGISSNLIAEESNYVKQIETHLLNDNFNGYGVVKGVAGQGLALLSLFRTLKIQFIPSLLTKKINYLIQHQEKDGSWLVETDNNKKKIKFTGFAHGSSGVICFLLGYLKIFGYKEIVKITIDKALQWLVNQSQEKNKKKVWYINDQSKQVDISLQNGLAGIALTFIKAYEVLKDPIYKQLAEDILNDFPHNMVTSDLSLSTGIIGLGEIYVEAFNVFKSPIWKERSDWVLQFILHHCHWKSNKACYWIIDESSTPTAGLINGNSGIIHFMLRYSFPAQISHPLLLW